MLLAYGIVCALLEAQRSGRGQVVDAAMVDGASLLTTMFWGMAAANRWSERRGDNVLDGAAPWYATYETRDGKYVAIGAIEPKFYDRAAATSRTVGGSAACTARPRRLAGAARAVRAGISHADARRMGSRVRGLRCVLRAGADVLRGGAASAQRRARAVMPTSAASSSRRRRRGCRGRRAAVRGAPPERGAQGACSAARLGIHAGARSRRCAVTGLGCD